MFLLKIVGFVSQKIIPNRYKIWGSVSQSAEVRTTFVLNEGLWVLRVRLDMGLVGLIESKQGRNTTP